MTGERGPISQYTPAERALQGNPGHRPSDVAETTQVIVPDALTYVPPAPDWLQGESDMSAMAVQAWGVLATLLVDSKALRESDLMSLARYCRYSAEWVQLTHDIDRDGFTVENTTKHGTTYGPNPAVMARARVEAAIAGLEKELGLAPKARQDLHRRLMAAFKDHPLIGDQINRKEKRGGPIGMLNAPEDEE